LRSPIPENILGSLQSEVLAVLGQSERNLRERHVETDEHRSHNLPGWSALHDGAERCRNVVSSGSESGPDQLAGGDCASQRGFRRLSPDSNPIDIQTLPKHSDEEMLLNAMGCEAANVHLGTRGRTKDILKGLEKRKRGWLEDAAERMAKILEKDWKRNRKH
jgi:hypothetical protein